MQIEMMKEQQAKEAQAAQDAKDAQHKQELADLRTGARTAATGSVGDYFSQQGVDPTPYEGSIATQLNNILSGISPTDENPGASFTGAGAQIYNQLQSAGQAKALGQVNQQFAPNFEMTRLPSTMATPYEQGLEAEQYSAADKIIKNMLDRGVLTQAGYNSASQDLQNQVAGVNAKLNELGTGLLAGEQSKLRDIAGTARTTASNLKLGDQFDPGTYTSQADQSFNDFIKNFGDNLRAQVPGSLFNTAGLAAIGGAGQGAGNTAYNPQAAAGLATDDTTTDTSKGNTGTNPNSIF